MGRTILENQVRVAQITKTEMDTSAHDLQRVMFTVTADADELLYLDEAIFQEPLTIETCWCNRKHRRFTGTG